MSSATVNYVQQEIRKGRKVRDAKFYGSLGTESLCRMLKVFQDPSPQLIHLSIALHISGYFTQLAKVCFSALLNEVAVQDDICFILALSLENLGLNFLWDDALECQPSAKGSCIHCLEKLILKTLQYLCNYQCQVEKTQV